MTKDFLPISKQDLKKRGWRQLDIILISGDAYVDHPSYGVAVISRVLENKGYKVGIIAQPDWRNNRDFLALGAPRLFFGITSGNLDSMVANYTANKRPRTSDDYSPGARAGLRPDRALIVYANKVREIFDKAVIVLGGIEASLRRMAYYDYWDNNLRRSILMDAKADILVYGMGETQILEIAQRLDRGKRSDSLNHIRGTVVLRPDLSFLKDYTMLASFEEIKKDKAKFNSAFRKIYTQQDPFNARTLAQKHGNRFIVQFPVVLPLSTEQLDAVYELPYMRLPHPAYGAGKDAVAGFTTVRFSLISHRGCCGECSFCSLNFHQGRIIQSRSAASLLKEAELISKLNDFKGTITDVGGPTANLYQAKCALWKNLRICGDKTCLMPEKCRNLKLGYEQSLKLYQRIMHLPRVKHVFISSGFRYDLLSQRYAYKYLFGLCRYHISGQMKVAPEHKTDLVLGIMNKPSFSAYEKFLDQFLEINKKLKKKIFLVNYYINAHPGSGLKEALELGQYFLKRKIHPEQIQDFIPLPMTLSSCIYYSHS